VIGGSLRGRRLLGPPGRSTRPTSDKVREAIFDSLASLEASGSSRSLEGAVVLDLFAGTGALGLEALSRGASRAVFVESDPRVATVIRRNLSSLALGSERAEVVVADAFGYLRGRRRPGEIHEDVAFDVAFCDPPYGFERFGELLELLPSGLVVLESEAGALAKEPPEGWVVLRQRRYGGTLVTMVARKDR
jgi:16S rRNA (guanine966-N2)-methyltransferase